MSARFNLAQSFLADFRDMQICDQWICKTGVGANTAAPAGADYSNIDPIHINLPEYRVFALVVYFKTEN